MKARMKEVMNILSCRMSFILKILARRRVAVGGLSALVALTGLVSIWLTQRVPATAAAVPDEIDLAIEATLQWVLSQPDCPKDQESLDQAVRVWFSALHPDLAVRLLREDPAFVQAEQAAFATISNPAQVYQDLMKDEDYRRQSEERARALTQGVAEGNANMLRDMAAHIATLKNPREMEAELMSNPEWRRMREEPLRILAPRASEGAQME